jgi:hypothetical protein
MKRHQSLLLRCVHHSFRICLKIKLKRGALLLAMLENRLLKLQSYYQLYQHSFSVADFDLCEKLLNNFRHIQIKELPKAKAENSDTVKDSFTLTLKIFFDAVNKAGQNAFITFGTLLGHVRDKQFITWDNDIDVGFIYDETNIDLLITSLKTAGFKILEYTGSSFPCKIKCRLPNCPIVDITFFKRSGDYFITAGRLLNGQTLIRNRTAFELEDTLYYNVSIKIPKNPEIFLAENYGDWKTPTEIYHYILDSKLTKFTSPGVLFLAMGVFLKHVQQCNHKAIIHYTKLFNDKFPDERLWETMKTKLVTK